MAPETIDREARGSILEEFGGNALLFVALIVLLTIVPLLPGHHTESMINRIVWTAVIVAGLIRAMGSRRLLWIALAIAAPGLAGRWVDIPGMPGTEPLLIAVFFALVAGHILAQIFQQTRIGLDQIIGGINVYVLLGVIFTMLHMAVLQNSPHAYMLGDLPVAEAALESGQQVEELLRYFSFTTLTTLGYGDIRPASQGARMLANGEAVIGQLFIAILIARLVSAYAPVTRAD